MRKLDLYITEKLKLNQNSKNEFSLDDMSEGTNMVLYDDTDIDPDEDNSEDLWEQCTADLENIDDNYEGFIIFKWYSITDKHWKHIDEDSIYKYYGDIDDVKNAIITGRDLGYAIRLKDGHMEIDCINSGSRGRYYIYALTKNGFSIVYDYMRGYDDTYKDLDFFWEDEEHKYIEPIILK